MSDAPYASYDDLYRPTKAEAPTPAPKSRPSMESAAPPPDGKLVPPPTAPLKVARLVAREIFTEGEHLHLRSHRGEFYRWNGTCWVDAEDRGIRGKIYRFLDSAVYMKASAPEPWDPTRHKIDNVIDALKAIAYLDGATEPPAWIDNENDLRIPASEIVAMANGLLHVPTRELLPHTPDYFVHHSLPYEFDPDAPTPDRWLQFLKEVWDDDHDSIGALQEVFGYIVAGGTEQQKIFLLVGPKRGGKGTIGRVLTGLLGRHNTAAPTLAGLATNFGVSPLIDRPLALVSDARLGTKADASIVVERLLSISGEDSLTIDRKYREPWTGRLPTRFMVLTNELPRLSDSSGALASRFVMLVLTKSFYGQENPKLTAELLEEAPAILNWSLEGLDRLNDRGYFKLPATSAEAIRQLEDLASPVSAFMRERCRIDASASVPVESLWAEWKMWCEDANMRLGTKATFGRDLSAAAPTISKARPRDGDNRVYSYEGIGLAGTTSRWSPDHPDQEASGPSGPRTAALYSPLGDLGHHGHKDAV